jgi:hypothetical protein
MRCMPKPALIMDHYEDRRNTYPVTAVDARRSQSYFLRWLSGVKARLLMPAHPDFQ